MKRILLLMVACLGCATTRHSSLERYAIIGSRNGQWGSGIVMGQGYVIAAKHVLSQEDSIAPFYIFFKGAVDSSGVVIDTVGDMVLIRSSQGKPLDLVIVGEASYLETLIWVQPHFRSEGPPMMFVITGKTARYDKGSWYVDHAVVPGVSGTGVWDSDGELVGMMHMFWASEYGVVYGVFVPIPDRILDHMRPIKDPFGFLGRSP